MALSPQQEAMRAVRVARSLGATLGVLAGCVLGLSPLLVLGFFKEEKAEKAD